MGTHPDTIERTRIFKSARGSDELQWKPSEDTQRTIEELVKLLGEERTHQIIKSMMGEARKELSTILAEVVSYAKADSA